MMRRILQDEQERLDNLSNPQITTTNTVTLPKEPEQEVSRFAQWAFAFILSALGCLVTAFGFALASIMTGVIVGIVLAGFFLLTSISLGILSLRENL
jgi:hypothetical protein